MLIALYVALLGLAFLYVELGRRSSLLFGDWLVVRYAADATVAESWELRQKEIVSAKGIGFSTDNGSVHLVKDYAFLQVVNGDWENARKRLLQK